jgi:hypothetical protein
MTTTTITDNKMMIMSMMDLGDILEVDMVVNMTANMKANMKADTEADMEIDHAQDL